MFTDFDGLKRGLDKFMEEEERSVSNCDGFLVRGGRSLNTNSGGTQQEKTMSFIPSWWGFGKHLVGHSLTTHNIGLHQWFPN